MFVKMAAQIINELPILINPDDEINYIVSKYN